MVYYRKNYSNSGSRGVRRSGNCFNCGMQGHWASTCFKKKQANYGRSRGNYSNRRY